MLAKRNFVVEYYIKAPSIWSNKPVWFKEITYRYFHLGMDIRSLKPALSAAEKRWSYQKFICA
jgi:ABC-type uncharacterized transport system permease subunit